MDDTDYGRRTSKSPSRKNRLIVGGSSLPIGILICYALNKAGFMPTEPEIQWAINSAIGSVLTVIALCADDFRAIMLTRYGRKRITDTRYRR